MNGLNRVDLIGNLGGDPEFRTMQSGKPVANFSVATNEVYKDRQTGDYKSRTPSGTGSPSSRKAWSTC